MGFLFGLIIGVVGVGFIVIVVVVDVVEYLFKVMVMVYWLVVEMVIDLDVLFVIVILFKFYW